MCPFSRVKSEQLSDYIYNIDAILRQRKVFKRIFVPLTVLEYELRGALFEIETSVKFGTRFSIVMGVINSEPVKKRINIGTNNVLVCLDFVFVKSF